MNYTIKSVVIIGAVAVVSFFVASAVIPERGAVAPVNKSAAPKGFMPPRSAYSGDVGDIPVVVADDTPVSNPIVAPGANAVPVDLHVTHEAPPPATPVAAVVPPPAPPVAVAVPPTPPVATPKPTPAQAPAMPPVAMAVPPSPEPPAPPASRPTLPPTVTLLPVMPAAPIGTKLAPIEIKPSATFTTKEPAPTAATPATAAAAPDIPKKKPEPGQLGYKLAKAAVCASVENRAPAGITDRFSKNAEAVYYFTHLVGATDSAAVLHRWYHDGKLIQTSILQIKSPNWRTHSKRNLTTVEEPAGSWKVEVVDMGTGKVLESAQFVVE